MTVAKAALTPMMAQYLDIKAQYADALLFYRMGDFYEMFFDDAAAAAAALDIALTKRGKHLGDDIPMCGVPVHSSEGYLLTLIRKGFRVAVCEQLEDPAQARKRGPKSVVKRDVVRLVTPGTLTEDALLDARHNNFLAAFAEIRGAGALAWVDISTGAFGVTTCGRDRLSPELARIAPREVVLSDSADTVLAEIVADIGASPTILGGGAFDSDVANRRLTELFRVGTIEAYGQFTRQEQAVMGAIVAYLDITQKGNLPLLRPPVREPDSGAMQIDAATRRNLELTRTLSGDRQGSLLSVIDRTTTAAGARLLDRRLSGPSMDLDVIRPRLDAVQFLVQKADIRDRLQSELRRTPDIERALSRLALGRGGPRDLGAIRNALAASGAIHIGLGDTGAPALLKTLTRDLTGLDALSEFLESALIAEPPVAVRDGGFVAAGHDPDLDDALRLRDQGRSVIAGMQSTLAATAGIPSLKIKHNNVLGYFVETTTAHSDKMLSAPLAETFIHRQTTASAIRFTTVALSELETRILNAGNRAQDIERQVFENIRRSVLANAAPLGALAHSLAEIDMLAGLADLAASEDWCRPDVDDSRCLDIRQGRHPVVETALRRQGGAPFVPNDCTLSDGSEGADIWLLTGPNMAGKSTFLRQNAVVVLLAQIGSYVPAASASVGLVSQLFSRVGASDDLARGRSTFMVEMVETAAILNQAGERALVILDEIGRGTATYDGLSIAWATLEHLHDVNRCRTLFATHYHELTQLTDRLKGAVNATVAVKEWEGEVIFLHEVRPGAADRSYGVQVARLAGLPAAVIARAREVLARLEKDAREGSGPAGRNIEELPLFSAGAANRPPPAIRSLLDQRLDDVRPDEMSPRQALDLIYELKALIRGSN